MRALALIIMVFCCGMAVLADTTAPQNITIMNAAGQPMANARLHGRITDTTIAPAYSMPEEYYTDAQGRCELKRNQQILAPGVYLLALASEEQEGAVVAVTVQADGVLNPNRYTLTDTPRDITQTVYGYDGAPAAHASVHASYCTQDTAHLLDEVSDATGTVIWKALPHVRIITWGDQIPAGVIPPDAEAIAKPLPAPTPEMECSAMLRPANPIEGAEPVRWWSTHNRQNGQESNGAGSYDPTKKGSAFTYFPSLTNGETVSVVLLGNGAVPRLAYLDNVYAPYNEYSSVITIPLTFAPLLRIHGALVDAHGAAALGVSRLHVLPANSGALPRLLLRPEVRALGLLQVALADAGHFTVAVPQAGEYRLLIDLFDENVPTPPTLRFTAAADRCNPTITLPALLFTAPGGSEVRYLLRNAPANTRLLTVAAGAAAMPVYGPREALLQLACRPAPNVLLKWDAARQTITTLPLHHTTLALRTSDGAPAYGRVTLEPLLPSLDNTHTPGAESDAQSVIGPQQSLDLWPGVYFTRQAIPGTTDDCLLPFTVPAMIANPVPVTIAQDEWVNPLYRSLTLTFPKGQSPGDAEMKNIPHSSNFAVRYDAPVTEPYGTSGYAPAASSIVHVPLRARKMSLCWLGVGTLDDVPLPDPEENLQFHSLEPTALTLPAWLPGVSVRGRILTLDGAPWAKGKLCCSLGNWQNNCSLMVLTDAEGRFTGNGVPVGNLFLYAQGNTFKMFSDGAWALEVPKTGLDGLTLRMHDPDDNSNSGFSIKLQLTYWNTPQQQLWWIPDGGMAHPLPTENQWFHCSETHFAGTGWLWNIDNDTGKAQSFATRLQPGAGVGDYSKRPNDGGPLGIMVTGDFRRGLPGTVTLLGRNALAPIRADFIRPQWRSLSALGAVAMQIESVPPGDYTVIVNTSDGVFRQPVTVTEVGGSVTLAM